MRGIFNRDGRECRVRDEKGRRRPDKPVEAIVADGTSGTYTSPFLNPNGAGGLKNISHVTAYVGTVIPLPAALPMFLASLGGLFWVGRRRRRAVAGAA